MGYVYKTNYSIYLFQYFTKNIKFIYLSNKKVDTRITFCIQVPTLVEVNSFELFIKRTGI